jgi:hypothetical protein
MDIKTIAGGIGGAAAGVAGIVIGITSAGVGAIVIGVAFLAVTAIALIAGATATPQGSLPPKPSIGAKFLGVPDGAFWLIVAILVVGLVIGGILLAVA